MAAGGFPTGVPAAQRLQGWAEAALDSGSAWVEALSPDARWLVLGSALVLAVNFLGMSVG